MSSFLERLPDINFAEKDTAVIEAEVIAQFEGVIGRRLFPGDPVRLLLLAFVKYLSLQRSAIDFSGKQNLIKYSIGGYLENLAALVGTERLPPSAAVTTLHFTLSTTFPSNITIPKGTRATPGGKIHFATDEDAEIKAGEQSVEINATCTQTGIIGNGFYPGQINMITDPFPYTHTVENTTITQGGADVEDEEAFRARTHIAPEGYSSAGPYGAYIYWAKTASQLISDVSVVSPSPGVVEIIPLLSDGSIPTQTLLDSVYAECNDENRRPLTDHVIVRAPEEVFYDLEITYFISRKDSAIGLNLQQLVLKATDRYVLWQKTALGRDLNPSKLTEMIMETGIKRMVVTKPEHTAMEYYQIAVINPDSVSIIYGGLEDD